MAEPGDMAEPVNVAEPAGMAAPSAMAQPRDEAGPGGNGEPASKGEPHREGSPYPKADLTLRGLARLADFTIAFGVATSAPGVGPLVAAAYLLLADGLMQGQSPGKKIFGVKAVVPATRAPAGFQESLLRNAPFAVVTLFWALPILWPVFFLVGLPVVGYEAWQVWDEPLGRRLGDRLADTQVVDGKVVAGIPSAASGGQ